MGGCDICIVECNREKNHFPIHSKCLCGICTIPARVYLPRARVDERLDDVRLPLTSRPHQRGVAGLVRRVHVGSRV